MARNPQVVAIAPRTLVLALALFVLMRLIQVTIGTLVLILISLIIAAALEPWVRFMVERRIPRVVAVLWVYFGFLLAAGLVLVIAVPKAIAEANLLITNLPTYARMTQDWLGQVLSLGNRFHVLPAEGPLLNQIGSLLSTQAAAWLRNGVTYVIQAVTAVFDALIVLLLSLFFLMHGPEIGAGLIALFPADERPVVRAQIDPLVRTLGNYVRGQIMSMGALAGILAIGLTLVGVPYAWLLALISGVFEIVPWLGGFMGLLISSLVAVAISWKVLILTWVVFTVAHVVQGDVLGPFIQSRVVRIPPAIILSALILGGELLGILGAIVAVPLTAMLFVIAEGVFIPIQDRKTGSPPPRAEDPGEPH